MSVTTVRLNRIRALVIVATSLAIASGLIIRHASADEVLFNNGDKLTGKVLSAEGGKLKIKTAVAGEVTVDMKDVKTFTTDEPVELRTKTGEVITAPATTQPAEKSGSVTVQPSSATEPRDVPLADLKYVNFNQQWTGSIIAGALFARGNTYSDQANIAFDAQRRTIDDRLTFTAGYNVGRQRDPNTGDKVSTVDNWYGTAKYDYFFTEKFYGFGSFRYEHDRIANLDTRLIPGVGVGYFWFDEPDFKFDTEVGLAYVYEKYEDGDTSESLSGRLAYHLKKDLWDDKVVLFHNLEFYPSLERADDFLVITDAGVRAALTERMFAEYKIEYRYDSQPADGFDKTDLRHIVGVGWKF